ncbi:MAG: SCO family protein [Actinomycetota bacterium]|nr:SCO family protein [Actinomycetota bacterium]
MPGMGSGLSADNQTIVSAFKEALLHEGLIVLVILGLAALAWQALRFVESRRLAQGPSAPATTGTPATPASGVLDRAPWAGLVPAMPEAAGRRLLRVGFGCLWLFDGFLQAQPAMPLGMATSVIEPTAATSPAWVQHVADAGTTVWSFHPIAAATSAVWIQLGIGLWLIVAPRGNWSRLAGVAAGAWGAVVWVFGEAFGGIFAPGLSWLFGAPGAVVFYVFAGVLVAVPERWWASPRLGRAVLAVMGGFFAVMALLQAWPGRGFWVGRDGLRLGSLATMVQQMATTPQPRFLVSWLRAFETFDATHGFAVNLFVVVALGLLGLGFLSLGTHPRALRGAVVASSALCLANWVLVQDLGFLGGVGTDPNSMVPMAVLITAGYLAVARVPVPAEAVQPAGAFARAEEAEARQAGAPAGWRPAWGQLWREGLASWRDAVASHPGYLGRSVVAVGAVGIVTLGAAPMALASINPNAAPIIAQATDGTPGTADYVPRDFHLVDQFGRPVSLASLRGKTVAITFLDPVCTNECPVIAQEFKQADTMLGSLRSRVELVGVVANPVYHAVAFVDAFDRQEGLQHVANWLYLTGSLPALAETWSEFGVQVQYLPSGSMIGHSEVAYVIGPHGRVRLSLDDDPGPATQASRSSFAVTLAQGIREVARGQVAGRTAPA